MAITKTSGDGFALYNGVELPNINDVWIDTTTYPYACIVTYPLGEANIVSLQLTSTPMFVYCNPSGNITGDYIENGSSYMTFYHNNGAWISFGSGVVNDNDLNSNIDGFSCVWASYNVYKYVPDSGVTNILVLEASDPVSCSSHMVTSSGDGFALYNGIKLPSIEEVWTDKTLRPYSVLAGADGQYSAILLSDKVIYNGAYFDSENDMARADSFICFTTKSALSSFCEELGISIEDAYAMGVNIEMWIPMAEDMSVGKIDTPFWTSHEIINVVDNSTYLGYSNPIALDGMTVVEWDGDTEGLIKYSEYFNYYKLIDYIEKPSTYAIVADIDGNLFTDFIALSEEDGWMAFPGLDDTWPLILGVRDSSNTASSGVYAATSIRLLAYGGTSEIYDDTWPIGWRTTEVKTNKEIVLDGEPLVKVSNIIPSTEDMRLAIITISAFGEAKYVDEAEWEGHIVYWYNNADLGEIPIVVSDGLVYEAGIYCMNIGILGDEYDWVITLTKPDSDEETDLMPVYKRVNGTWVKQTAYQRQNGEWVLISFAEQSESVSHTVRFLNWDGTLLETVIVETDGGMAVYTGETPTKPNTNAQEDWEFIGWNPEPTNVTGDMDCVAQFKNKVSMARLLLQRTLAGAYANNRVTKVGQYVFYGCSKLTSLDFANVTSIEANAFNGCSGLETLILRSSKVCTLSATNAFTSTKITSGTGYIYVPSALLANYQSATNWSTYASKFRAIEDYPEICGGE